MEETCSVVLTLVFQNDSSSRNVTLKGVDVEALMGVKSKVKALNANMPASFAQTFTSATGKPCVAISRAQIIQVEEEVIYSAS